MFLRDFLCEGCNERFEDYVSSSQDRFAPCPQCGQPCEIVPSVPRVGAYSMKDTAGRAEVLKKRSHEDTMKNLKKEPEKHGFKAAAPPSRWNFRNTPKNS